MKIIDNKKDRYDYLASIYGIDDLVVYDHRGSVTLIPDKVLSQGMEYYFSHRILFLDMPISVKSYWNLQSIAKRRETKLKKHSYRKTFKEGDVYHFVLNDVGHKLFIFCSSFYSYSIEKREMLHGK